MRRVMKTILLTAMLLAGLLQSARAYSLGGPIANGGDAWQVVALSYNLPGDLNAPKNLGEGYRRNVPVMYYTFDENFVGYFGTAGMDAIDSAFVVLNRTFTNSPAGLTEGMDGYSYALSEFPLETRHINYQAEALGVVDMKTWTISMMVEQLGLADPVRYAWTLHDRYLPPGGVCPLDEEYLVVQRNFDTVPTALNTLQYTPYVNNVLYTYQIIEDCPVRQEAISEPYSVDPLADVYSPIASQLDTVLQLWGNYVTGLTRDDAAGLRYLLQTNNVNYEDIPADSLLYTITTNFDYQALITFPPLVSSATNFLSGTNYGYYVFMGGTNGEWGYGDLVALLAYASTNGPLNFMAQYPGVVISSVATNLIEATNVSYSLYYTNPPYGSPYGSPQVLVLATNYSLFYQVQYTYQFANVFTNHWVKGTADLITTTVGVPIGAPYGSPGVTNSTVTKVPQYYGDFFVLPPFYTNFCPLDIINNAGLPPITGVLAVTNGLAIIQTNGATTNLSSMVYQVTYFTNYSYAILPTTCTATPATDYYQGIEKIHFERVDYTNLDTFTESFWVPITNNYTMVRRNPTNGLLQVQYLQRIVTIPDILFTARDLVPGADGPAGLTTFARNLTFDEQHVLQGLAGPGTVNNKTVMIWNKGGQTYFNTPLGSMDGTPYFTSDPETASFTNLFWQSYYVLGIFDGTTNDPTVFPDGTSIQNLEYQMLVQVSPTTVADGTAGVAYSAVQFTATGGLLNGALNWTAENLPDGLSLSPDGVLSGTPLYEGTYDFTITVTDSSKQPQSVSWTYPITINE